MNGSSWLPYQKPSRNAYVRLFCFPYAAKGASSYRRYADHVPPRIDVCAVQLPGREERLAEPAFTALPDLVGALGDALKPYLDLPFAFFGQSMGALVQFELARRLRDEGVAMPVHLFVAREQAPHLIHPPEVTNDRLTDEEFLADTQRIPLDSPLRANSDILNLMLPTYRADSLVIEKYVYVPSHPLNCPITAFAANQDAIVRIEDIQSWDEHTTDTFRLQVLPVTGLELFQPEAESVMCAAIVEELEILA